MKNVMMMLTVGLALALGAACQDGEIVDEEEIASEEYAEEIAPSSYGRFFRNSRAGIGDVCGDLGGEYVLLTGRCWTRGAKLGRLSGYTWATCTAAGGQYSSPYCWWRSPDGPPGQYYGDSILASQTGPTFTDQVCMGVDARFAGVCDWVGGVATLDTATCGIYEPYRCDIGFGRLSYKNGSHPWEDLECEGPSVQGFYSYYTDGGGGQHYKCWTHTWKPAFAYMDASEDMACADLGGDFNLNVNTCWHAISAMPPIEL